MHGIHIWDQTLIRDVIRYGICTGSAVMRAISVGGIVREARINNHIIMQYKEEKEEEEEEEEELLRKE